VTGRGLTDEECDQRSRRALWLNLGRNPVKGHHGPRWTKARLWQLDKEPDAVVAVNTGRTRAPRECRGGGSVSLTPDPNPRPGWRPACSPLNSRHVFVVGPRAFALAEESKACPHWRRQRRPRG
jgi:hypothetical protein